MRRILFALSLGALLCAPAARADVWDTSGDNDNDGGTDFFITHGSHSETHDLGVQSTPTFSCATPPCADEDWYGVELAIQTSFEVVVDATTGDLGPGLDVELMDYYGAAIPGAVMTGVDGSAFSRSLRWDTGAVGGYFYGYVRVSGAACGTSCTTADTYGIAARETSYSLPRFNNSSSQITIVQIQNATDDTVATNIDFFNASGLFLGTHSVTLAPHRLLVLNTSTLGFASGQSGSAIVRHNGRYGALAGKAVAVEPATGFTFDTPMVARVI